MTTIICPERDDEEIPVRLCLLRHMHARHHGRVRCKVCAQGVTLLRDAAPKQQAEQAPRTTRMSAAPAMPAPQRTPVTQQPAPTRQDTPGRSGTVRPPTLRGTGTVNARKARPRFRTTEGTPAPCVVVQNAPRPKQPRGIAGRRLRQQMRQRLLDVLRERLVRSMFRSAVLPALEHLLAPDSEHPPMQGVWIAPAIDHAMPGAACAPLGIPCGSVTGILKVTACNVPLIESLCESPLPAGAATKGPETPPSACDAAPETDRATEDTPPASDAPWSPPQVLAAAIHADLLHPQHPRVPLSRLASTYNRIAAQVGVDETTVAGLARRARANGVSIPLAPFEGRKCVTDTKRTRHFVAKHTRNFGAVLPRGQGK